MSYSVVFLYVFVVPKGRSVVNSSVFVGDMSKSVVFLYVCVVSEGPLFVNSSVLTCFYVFSSTFGLSDGRRAAMS